MSVVLPVFNEAGNLARLTEEIFEAAAVARCEAEVIAVDDASSDESWSVLSSLAQSDSRIRAVRHTRNCGQSAAIATGFNMARGPLVVTLDADGQNDPADLPMLLEELTDQVDAVCGVRMGRKDSWVKMISSRVGNRFRNWVTGDSIQDAGCTFRVIRREAIHELPVFNGLHRFLPTILRYQGYQVVEVPIHHRPRVWGVSKYGIGNRLWRGVADCLAMRWWRKRAIPGRRMMRDGLL